MDSKKNMVRTHLQAQIFIEALGADGTLQDYNIGHARLQNFSADHDYGAQPVHGVGDYLPAEFVHLKFSGTIQISAFAIRKRDLVALGLAALGEAILTVGAINVKLVDPTTGTIVRVYEGCVMSRYSERVQEGQICGEDGTMLFRNVRHDPDTYEKVEAPDPGEYKPLASIGGAVPAATTTTPADGSSTPAAS